MMTMMKMMSVILYPLFGIKFSIFIFNFIEHYLQVVIVVVVVVMVVVVVVVIIIIVVVVVVVTVWMVYQLQDKRSSGHEVGNLCNKQRITYSYIPPLEFFQEIAFL